MINDLEKPVEAFSTGFFYVLYYNRIMFDTKITKSDLVDSVYKSTDIEKKVILQVVDSFLLNMRNVMEEGSTIELRGFGTFEKRLRKGRAAARNPKTGEKIKVEPHYVEVFRAGQILKDKLWNLQINEDE